MAMTEEHNSMHFLDHLEELRWRLVKSLGSVLLGAVITFFFIDQLIAFLIRPTQDLASPMDLQVLKVQGMFMIKWGIAMIGGIVLSIPVLTYQLWKFIAPGLYLNEKKYAAPLIIFTYISFLIGLIFAYTVIIPFSLDFFTSVGMSGIQNNFSINYYFNFITWLMIGSGFIFELPVLVFILSIIGLLTPAFMSHYRRHASVVILVLSAFITPPDPVSLVLMAIPLMLLYEFSIGVSWLVNRKKQG
ncbi:MAG: twin-arginine translocase subunit TatC [Candidatus Marinimicrobia bacterium]|jgi:sec-independent protein translocase protein TatC|nr:twin-arginine translocase subunit TatC [Candidatus Neomarinimicrobiota bacterium]MBT3676498.1 twin-arginine translocase subunit TatC [Candidatus Neomarinimicrobiota bacterium]MBT3763219.1 twin-arginine translocase subunit TatC [Candidatus Neomarinimicrobiota bacterium]MBT4067652.1 twin-arginine translocase subunit TatC [Candidatus Neomarinimicrobiota bacterium]MBT4270689.1 twin-arginine translocase subunit TatC [Candidatus Neomarinimicrobiota bacterium]